MDLNSFINRLETSFETLGARAVQELHEEVRQIQQHFKRIDRRLHRSSELVGSKYKMQHWRQKVLARILGLVDAGFSAEEGKTALATLGLLELKPAPADLKKLAAWIEKKRDNALSRAGAEYFAGIAEHELVLRVLSDADEELLRIAGPRKTPPIEANIPSRWTFKKWSRLSEMSNYAYRDEGVLYRGIQFLPGDVFLCNVNRDGNGVYTVLAEPRSYGSHIGVFAIIEHEGRSLPVVVESYKLGVRAVPLSSFLAPKANSYVEVMRLKAKPAGFHEKINAQAARIESQTKGYNFDTEDPDRNYLACSTVATHLFELAGAPAVKARSWYCEHPVVRKTRENVGLLVPAFLAPSDFLVDEKLEFVGAVDNSHFWNNVARELTDRHFLRILESMVITPSKIPFLVTINKFGIRQVRANNLIGKIIGLATGFNHINLPRGSEQLLAMIELYEHWVASAVKRLAPQLGPYTQPGKPVDIERMCLDPRIEQLCLRYLVKIIKTCVAQESLSPSEASPPASATDAAEGATELS